VQFTAIAWNLFHGRDFPPDPGLFTWGSRLLRVSEHNATHVQVNRELLDEFAAVLAGAEWDVGAAAGDAAPLRRAAGAGLRRRGAPGLDLAQRPRALRAAAARLNPDLIASGEGGSNLTLVRRGGALGGIVERRGIAVHEGRPERRAMALTRTASGVCLANLHATSNQPPLAVADVLLAARAAVEFTGEAPLLFGGDLNLRPRQNPELFAELAERYGLSGPPRPTRSTTSWRAAWSRSSRRRPGCPSAAS
jgi:hypothetical protein